VSGSRRSSQSARSANDHIRILMQADTSEGMKSALLMSSHPVVPRLIDPTNVGLDDLIKLFSWLAISGDRFSQLGAVEWALSHLDTHPQLEPSLLELVMRLFNDDPTDRAGRLRLLCGLIVLVDGELARIGL